MSDKRRKITLLDVLEIANIGHTVYIVSEASGNVIYKGNVLDCLNDAGILFDREVRQISANDYSKLYVIITDLFLNID